MTQKKAILLVSFGTSYLESKEKTIDRLLSFAILQFIAPKGGDHTKIFTCSKGLHCKAMQTKYTKVILES